MATSKTVQDNLGALRKMLKSNKLDGYIITNNLDQQYLGGFHLYPGEGVFVVTAKQVVCVVRTLYVAPLTQQVPCFEIVGEDKDRVSVAVAKARALKLTRVGFDAAKESYFAGTLFRENGFVEAGSFVSTLRERKSSAELKHLRAANRLAYLTYEYIKPRIKTGMTECEVAAEMEKFMRVNGASGTSFDTIVAFGENSANPHHETGQRKLKSEDAILLDFGCVYEGYCSDITRSWWHGKKEPAEYTKIWKLTDKARKAGIKALRIGTPTKQVDAAARDIISAAGYGPYFTHRTGHGVGMEIHEEPCNDAQSQAVLAEGNVVTVEPGIYLPGKFGVRLEDTLAVGPRGAVILTKK